MKRLGRYSGRIYEENEILNMEECGICITDEQSNNKEWIESRHAIESAFCDTCGGCPMIQKGGN